MSYNEKSVGEIVRDDYRKAVVLKKYGIEFCCGGKKKFSQACSDKGVDINTLLHEFEEIENDPPIAEDIYTTMSVDVLTEHIIKKHHAYVTRINPVLFEYTQKVARVHGTNHPELITIAELFIEVMSDLNSHMMKEENILFPYIKSLAIATNVQPPPFGTVKNPISMMEDEHETVGKLFEKIVQLSNNYTPPADACSTYRITFSLLKEYEEDLHKHIHLENNILFPKAIELETSLFSKQHLS